MARGWESKSVELQQSDRTDGSQTKREVLSTVEQEVNRQREGLLLSRKRTEALLQSATHPRHREMIEKALAEIDRKLAALSNTNPNT